MNKYKLTFTDIYISIIAIILVILVDLLQTTLIKNGIMPPQMHIYFKFRIVVLAIVSALFGPVVGFTVGISGTLMVCFITYGNAEVVQIVADAIFSTIIGMHADKYGVLTGKFTGIKLLDFNMVLLMANIFCSIIFPPISILLIFGGNLTDIVMTGIKAAFSNSLATGVVCTILFWIISQYMYKRNSNRLYPN